MQQHNLTNRITDMQMLLKLLALAKGLHAIEGAATGRSRARAGKSGNKRRSALSAFDLSSETR